MRLLLITNDFPSPWLPTRGTFNLEMARSLAKANDVQVVTPIAWVDKLCSRRAVTGEVARTRTETRDGLTIHYPRYYYTPWIARRYYHQFYWHSIRPTLQTQLRTFRPDAVLSYWAHPDGSVAVKFARQIGAPAFVMVGGSDVLCQAVDSPHRRRLISQTLCASDGVIVVSGHLRDRVIELGVSRERVHLVYRGVDRQRFSPGDKAAARTRLNLPGDVPVFLWVGRMEPVKGLDTLLRAAAKLQGDGRPFALVLAGDGSLRGRLEEMATGLGIQSSVRFAGPVPHSDLADYFRAADWTVLTSRSEGVPNVLLESHTCGTPFIATRVGGVPEIAVGSIDRLVEPGNAEAFAAAMGASLAVPPVDRESLADRVDGLAGAAAKIAEVIRRGIPRFPGGPVPESVDRPEPAPARRVVQGAAQASLRPEQNPKSLRQAVRRALAAVLPRSRFLVCGPRDRGGICLTFDDGPHPEHTPRVLDVLAELEIKATFFVIGREAARYPDIVRRIAAEGHALGNHTWSHPETKGLSTRVFADEIARTNCLLADITGAPIRLFRPPKGKVSARQLLQLWRLEQCVVLWNVDSKDYRCSTTDELWAGLIGYLPKPGDLVLMHDRLPFGAHVLADLAGLASRRGLTFTTVAEWIGAPLPERGSRAPSSNACCKRGTG